MYPFYRLLGCLLLAGFMLHGCSTVKNSLRDFNGYFNTYYNAKSSVERGLELQEQQEGTINPERPIRIHQVPHMVGQNDFRHAAEKGGDVIRFHPRSRWVDNAIEIIGLSYFYQQQYFSADQKFAELLTVTQNDRRRQQAILMRGRSALELENYIEGINYLQSQLYATDIDWRNSIRAEVKLVIAQLYVARREYEEAEGYLSTTITDVRDTRLEMRAYFLHGQILERLDRYDDAFQAYQNATHSSNPNYDLIYHAERKMGVVARKQGRFEWAYSHFSSMSRDDRHYRFLPEIEYEVARTQHERERYTEAMQRYRQTLQRRAQQPSREAKALIFYGMAEIYRDFYEDYSLTAAYFDSSYQQVNDIRLLPENFDADKMSDSYGDYNRLRLEINRLDSLLWLGNLSEAEFDSVMADIRAQRLEELRAQEREQRRGQMVSVDGMQQGAVAQADEVSESGFLNNQNQQLMQQMSQAFYAYWGQRPLVDNWRRMEGVRFEVMRQLEEEGEDDADIDEVIQEAVGSTDTEFIEIDLSEIPFSEEEKEGMLRVIASHEYEIGNVFSTSLALPDSAAVYYRRVMNRFPDSELAPQAIYSLSELYESAGDSAYAQQYAMQLIEFYPETIFAERVAGRYGYDFEIKKPLATRQDSLSAIYTELLLKHRSIERAMELTRFAEQNQESERAAEALFRSAVDYIELAREDEGYESRLYELFIAQTMWKQEREARETFRDSVKAVLADTLFLSEIIEVEKKRNAREVADRHDGTMEVQDEINAMLVSERSEINAMVTGIASMMNKRHADESDMVLQDAPVTEIPREDDLNEVADTLDAVKPEMAEQLADMANAELSEDEIQELTSDMTPVERAFFLRNQQRAQREARSGEGVESEEPEEEEEAYWSSEELAYVSHFHELANQRIREPDFGDLFPYNGALWDSARVSLFYLNERYPDFKGKRIANELASEIEVSRIQETLVDTAIVYACERIDVKPEPAVEIPVFLIDSGLQNVINRYQVHQELALDILVDAQGRAAEIDFKSEDTLSQDFMNDFASIIKEELVFQPSAMLYGRQVKARCHYAWDVMYQEGVEVEEPEVHDETETEEEAEESDASSEMEETTEPHLLEEQDNESNNEQD